MAEHGLHGIPPLPRIAPRSLVGAGTDLPADPGRRRATGAFQGMGSRQPGFPLPRRPARMARLGFAVLGPDAGSLAWPCAARSERIAVAECRTGESEGVPRVGRGSGMQGFAVAIRLPRPRLACGRAIVGCGALCRGQSAQGGAGSPARRPSVLECDLALAGQHCAPVALVGAAMAAMLFKGCKTIAAMAAPTGANGWVGAVRQPMSAAAGTAASPSPFRPASRPVRARPALRRRRRVRAGA
jgi:hypothetical protein